MQLINKLIALGVYMHRVVLCVVVAKHKKHKDNDDGGSRIQSKRGKLSTCSVGSGFYGFSWIQKGLFHHHHHFGGVFGINSTYTAVYCIFDVKSFP